MTRIFLPYRDMLFWVCKILIATRIMWPLVVSFSLTISSSTFGSIHFCVYECTVCVLVFLLQILILFITVFHLFIWLAYRHHGPNWTTLLFDSTKRLLHELLMMLMCLIIIMHLSIYYMHTKHGPTYSPYCPALASSCTTHVHFN